MSTSPPRCKRPAEQGFGLVELIIVLVIIAILVAVAIPSYNSAKRATRYKDAIVAANDYRQAISAFQADNGNNVPTTSTNPPIWTGTGATYALGPKNLIVPFGSPPKYYLKGDSPSEVAHGTMLVYGGALGSTVTNGSAPSGATSAQATAVQIAFPTRITFEIGVWTRDNGSSPWKLRCETGSTASTAAPKC